MTMVPSNDIHLLLIWSLGCIFICSVCSYVAWFSPQRYEQLLCLIGSLFSGIPGFKSYWCSRFNFWFQRIVFLVGILFGSGVFVLALINVFSSG